MKSIKLKSLVFTLFLTLATSHAGDRVENGGSGDEVSIVTAEYTLNSTIEKIFFFFETQPHVRNDFTDVNFKDLLELQGNLTVEVTDEELTDRQGKERDCLNSNDGRENILRCRRSYIAKYLNDPYNMFILGFHELLGITGDEVSSIHNESVMQSYPISSRLVKYVVPSNDYNLSTERPIVKRKKGPRTKCRNIAADSGIDQYCDMDRVRTHINKVEFYYSDTHANNYAFKSLGIKASGQVWKSCAAGDNKYCKDTGSGYFLRVRVVALDSDISIPTYGNAREEVSINDLSLSWIDFNMGTGQGPAVSATAPLGASRASLRAQLLKISYKNENRSRLLSVQIPFTLIDLESELQYNITKDGTLKVFIKGQVDLSIGSSKILTDQEYSKFNARANFSGETGLIIKDQIRISGLGQYAFNSNMINQENSYGGNLSVRVSDWLNIRGEYTRRNLGIEAHQNNQNNSITNESVNQFIFGIGGQF